MPFISKYSKFNLDFENAVKNWEKIFSFRFEQRLGTLTVLLFEGFSETGRFNIYLNTFWESVISKIQNLWGSSFFSKYLKFNLDIENTEKKWANFFCFWDNCMWIGNAQLSLLRRGYFSLAANVLTSSPKILHVNKRDFFQLNWLGSDQWIS